MQLLVFNILCILYTAMSVRTNCKDCIDNTDARVMSGFTAGVQFLCVSVQLVKVTSQNRMNGCDFWGPDNHLDSKIDQIDWVLSTHSLQIFFTNFPYCIYGGKILDPQDCSHMFEVWQHCVEPSENKILFFHGQQPVLFDTGFN
jgi:hypothetical protein